MVKMIFICENKPYYAQVAEIICAGHARAGLEVHSASVSCSRFGARTIKTLYKAGYDIVSRGYKTFEEVKYLEFDIAICLDYRGKEPGQMFSGNPIYINWEIENGPDAAGLSEDELIVRSCLKLKKLIADFFDGGYYSAIIKHQGNVNKILNNISDGIIAHDLKRKIVFFNRAASEITGVKHGDAISMDCHKVFNGGFCGGQCLFRGGDLPDLEAINFNHKFVRSDGAVKTLEIKKKPMLDDNDKVIGVITTFHDITRENELEIKAAASEGFCGIIGGDTKMLEIFNLINDLSESPVPVLIYGESGTGKELVASAIHKKSSRAAGPFVAVNCGALTETLLESELFGHARGAFTGAVRDKKGRFEMAAGGTLFLDEIGDITPAMQVKLLRVLQSGTFERVGGEETLKADVRIVSATNKDLRREIAAGRFREDLYYRLNVVPINVPPLRERRGDIAHIAAHILKNSPAAKLGEASISGEAMEALENYSWPGNIRELQNCLNYALVKSRGGRITKNFLPEPGTVQGGGLQSEAAFLPRQSVGAVLFGSAGEKKEPVSKKQRAAGGSEELLIIKGLDRNETIETIKNCRGNIARAARELGVSRATLYRFMKNNNIVFK